MKITERLGLKLPDGSDYVSIDMLNEIFEKLDALLVRNTGDTMTGDLTIERASPYFPALKLRSATTGIIGRVQSTGSGNVALARIEDANNQRLVEINSNGSLRYAIMTDGAWDVKHILHTGNLEALGVGQVVIGSYVGTGLYGAENANSLTFIAPPKFLMVQMLGWGAVGGYSSAGFAVMRGQTYCNTTEGANHTAGATLNWNEKIVSWYTDKGSTNTSAQENQLNLSGTTYLYIAIL